MKAIEYAEKILLADFSTEEEINKAIYNTAVSMMAEVVYCCSKIGARANDVLLISELQKKQEKWRNFAFIINETTGKEIIKRDGFRNFVVSKIPELKGKI